jgi:hypothetical protein
MIDRSTTERPRHDPWPGAASCRSGLLNLRKTFLPSPSASAATTELPGSALATPHRTYCAMREPGEVGRSRIREVRRSRDDAAMPWRAGHRATARTGRGTRGRRHSPRVWVFTQRSIVGVRVALIDGAPASRSRRRRVGAEQALVLEFCPKLRGNLRREDVDVLGDLFR